MPALWVYRNNRQYEGATIAVGDWRELFDLAPPEPIQWGSTEWIRSPESRKIIREELSPGDLFLCWQTDRRAAVGMARFAGAQQRGEWIDLHLEPVTFFRQPVRLRELAKRDRELAGVSFIAKHSRGTLARTSRSETEVILRACGVAATVLGDGNAPAAVKGVGAGFGDPLGNRQVEQAAIAATARHLRRQGWAVVDVSAQRGLGYDLLARREGQEQHVEVKGIRGTALRFVITDAELRASRRDGRWCLALVRAAVDDPRVELWSPGELHRLDIRPIAHLVREPHC